jgi:uncharacterized protein YqgQ
MSNLGETMFQITIIVKETARLYTFDTLQEAQDWLKACSISYDKATLVIDFDRNRK